MAKSGDSGINNPGRDPGGFDRGCDPVLGVEMTPLQNAHENVLAALNAMHGPQTLGRAKRVRWFLENANRYLNQVQAAKKPWWAFFFQKNTTNA